MSDATSVCDPDWLLTSGNAVLALIDYQPEQYRGVGSIDHDVLLHNVTTLGRVVQAGARPISVIGLAGELQRDWGRPGADRLRSILRSYFAGLRQLKQTSQ